MEYRTKTTWASHCFGNFAQRDARKFEKVSAITQVVIEEEEEDNELDKSLPSIDFILANDILERIMSFLPITSIFRAGAVCKNWNEIVKSQGFLKTLKDSTMSQKPWYFMFFNEEPWGVVYDHLVRKWYSINLPCVRSSNWYIASSFGLVCFMDDKNRRNVYVCNPITKASKKIPEPLGLDNSDYSALAISVDQKSHSYTISLVKCEQVPENFLEWNLSIQVYHSETRIWVTSVTEVLRGWRSGQESVICNGVLYFLIYVAGGGIGQFESHHALVMYDLNNLSSSASKIKTLIYAPCYLTCGRLMNLRDKLVMVGGIGKQNSVEGIRGVRIWILNGKEWKEVSRMPHKFFQGFGEFDDVFTSKGSDDLIYIQSYGSPNLLVFHMGKKEWKWAQKSPVTKKFPLQLFTGFCFEPRLEVSP